MAKFIMKNGSFWISALPAPTPVDATAIVKGTTTTITVANTAEVGDVVMIQGSGWNSLDNRLGQVTQATASGLTVALDTSGESNAAIVPADAFMYEDGDWIEACLQGMDLDSGTADTIAVGTFCDGGASLAGTIPNGTLALTGFVDPTDAGYQALLTASGNGLPYQFKLVLPKAAAPNAAANNGGVFYFANGTVGAVSQSYQTGAAATFTTTVVLGAKPVFVPAA